jgi:hypothetical protein
MMVSAVGIAPMRSVPVRPASMPDRSARSAAESATIRCAQATARSPSGVNPSKLRPRRTICTPSSLSSRRTGSDSAGCETWHAADARPKCRSRASALRYSS